MATIYTPIVGNVYKFTFQAGYDAQNGTYRLVKLMSYDEYLNDGGDLLTDFFEPNGKTDTELNADLNKIKASKIMKLIDPADTSTDPVATFAPLCYLESSPDYHIQKYTKFGVLAYVGTTRDPSDLDYMKDSLVEQIEATLGITPDPKFVAVGEEWLTDTEYAEIVASRDETKKKTTNYFSENKRLQAKVSSLQTIIKEYEKLIINQQQQIDKLKEQLQTHTGEGD